METKQSKKNSHTALNKAVKNINKLLQDRVKTTTPTKVVKSEPGSDSKVSAKNGKRNVRVSVDRGVVYLAHIPHGFYENEMKAFFSQFGHVTRLRLVRSNKTGNSRGYAFVEFRFTEVAQVVAETMNNYLMRNRLLKATYIPPEKQNPKMFLHSTKYGPETCIGVINQRKSVRKHNKPLSESETEDRVNRNKQHLVELQEKLKAQGVDCMFQVDDGTSERLLVKSEKSNPTVPPTKKPRTSSPAPSVKPSIVKQPSAVLVPKKHVVSTKGQKEVKMSKNVKAASDKTVKLATLKGEKKTVAKKTVDKKVAAKKLGPKKAVVKKTVAKKITPVKKDGAKKTVKKQIVKKK
ncbi:MKI67 FHA domain-interacting nucleolar phosphoprotein-like [Frankliniella occidentalis]|uniref:MKI67 FHA domain-interacting nucleolar phosphoprotein-like n=1 Tax=Frankliniella occidentalis TaxID=133901 RepID=A0A6J1SKU4_FRAOC|nr:MKI67 FHA domain-interacting nucleolar phosphoprotein-like [Frankliniella occidentalis]